jgi:hypothetical protein
LGDFYPVLATIHILFASIWLVSFLLDSLIYGNYRRADNKEVKMNSVSMYLKGTNLFGIIGATGILITGIIMVVFRPDYHFFQFTANHWLTTKQIITVVLLILIFASIIPKAKAIRGEMAKAVKEGSLSEKFDLLVKKLRKVNLITTVLVLLNFLFALSRYFMQ